MTLFVILVLFCIPWVSSQHNPFEDPYICGLKTCSDNGKFNYAVGTQQTYKYTVEVSSLFNGTSKNESTLFIEGNVNLKFPTPCEGILTLNNFKLAEKTSDIENNEQSQLFADNLSAFPLKFAFRDGNINQLCLTEHETEWVLNFKRGILNMFHNTMKRLDLDYSSDETDVRGTCPTQYTVIGAKETSLIIEKSKNLSACKGMGQIHSTVQSMSLPYYSTRPKQDNILKSSSHCTMSVDHNIYNSIMCEETHLLQAFSKQDSGATSHIKQELILIEETQVQSTEEEQEILKRLSLHFDHTISLKPTTDDLSIPNSLAKELCEFDKSQGVVNPSDTLRSFIYNLKTLSYKAISEFYQNIGAVCYNGRKHFLNVLPFLNTGPSVTLMKDIILQNAISKNLINEWVSTMAFISDPTAEMLIAANDLLQRPIFNHKTALSVSALIHTYCSKNTKCRDENIGVQESIQYLENIIRGSLKKNITDRQSQDDVMVALKALSNIGIVSESFYDELHLIIEDSRNNPALRVATIEIFRRLPCDSSRSYFEKIFRELDEDTEVRIASYLQMMRCPDYMLIRTIRSSLINEEVNQVGSFIFSHLNNLLTTANPLKVEIQSLISDEDLAKKFSSDFRKFSRNFEGSTYFGDYDIGGSYDSNVIFSSSSYLPKSAMINFTTVLFGESINLMEVYGRIDGFEHYLESFFGPKGDAKDLKENFLDRWRFPRGINKRDELQEQVKKLPNMNSNPLKEPKVSLGLKVFGNDFNYFTLNGEEEILGALQNVNPLYNLQRILSGKEIVYNKEAMFLDSKYVISTGAGLPLSLSVMGTAVVNLKLYGSLAYSKFSQAKELELDVTARIEPTISVDVTGEMAVDAFYASTGIKLKANMFSDSAVNSDIKIRGTRLVKAKFSLPKKNNEIINVRSELIVKEKNLEHAQRGISNNRISQTMCSLEAVEKTIGLKLCSSYSLVNVSKTNQISTFFLAGPASYSFFIHKADPTANIYSFEYKRTPSLVSAVFDTPGSNGKRLFSGNLTLEKGSHNLTVVFQSSEGTILLKGKVKNLPHAKMLQFTVSINNKEQFDVGASLYRYNVKNGFVYKPTVYVAVIKERIFTFKGNIDLISKRGISQYTVDLKFDTKRLNSKLFGYISKTDSSLEASLYSDYKFHLTKEQRFSIKFGIANRSPQNMIVVVGFCNLNSTAYPNLNIDSNATFQRSGSHMDLNIKLKQSPLPPEHPEAEFRTLTFDALISHKTFTDNKRTWEAKATLRKRSSNLDLKGGIIYETFKHSTNVISELKYGDNKEIVMTVHWSRPKQTLENIKLHVNVTASSFTPMVMKIEILEKQPNAFMIDFQGTWFSGHSITALAFYNDMSNSVSSNHRMKILLRSPSFKDTKIDGLYYRDNQLFKIILEANYDANIYHISTLHKSISTEETYFQIQIQYKSKLYKFVSTIFDGDYKKLDAELHFDEYRDLAIQCYLLNEENNKTLGFKFNWDANREPNQKLLITANYRKNGDFNYVSDVIMSYPGRTVKADYTFSLERGHLKTLLTLTWDEGRSAGMNIDISYNFDGVVDLSFDSQIFSPLDNWKITKIEGRFKHVNNKYNVHGLISWDKGHAIGLDFVGDYISTHYFWCRYSLSVSSSVESLPNVNLTLNHLQNATNLETNIYVKYKPEFVVAVDSYWRTESDKVYKNITGTIQSKTSFTALRDVSLVSKIFVKENKYLRGIADLDINHKKLSVNMEGKFKKITDCFLIVNATSLDGQYQIKYLISTEKRHLVAMLTYPTGNLGTEVLLGFNSILDFDVKLQLATPIEFLQNVLLVAKLKPEQVNFLVSWNVLSLGFFGVWHYESITHFEYVYKIFTPITNFEENGVVAKLVIDDGFDSEMSVQLSIYKLGFKLFGKEKPQLLKEIGVNLKELYSHSEITDSNASVDDLRWEGAIAVDIIIYPTMKGVVEINQLGETYYLQSKLTMPHGIAELTNEFYFHDILTMKNTMHLVTPYITFKTLTSDFELDVKPRKKYVFSLDMKYQNKAEIVQICGDLRYQSEVKDFYDKFYNLSLRLVTPFESFPKLNLLGTYESEENFYHPKLIFNTISSNISIDSIVEIDDALLELSSNFFIKTPSLHIPSTQLRLSKLFSVTKNYVEININSPDIFRNHVNLRTTWVIRSKLDFESLIQLETPFSGLQNTTTGLNFYLSKEKATLWTTLQIKPIEVEVNSTFQNNHFSALSNIVLKGKKYPIEVDCNLIDSEQNSKVFDGKLLIANYKYNISGYAEHNGALFDKLSLKLTPQDNGQLIIFNYQIDQISINEFHITGQFENSGKIDKFKAKLLAFALFNWDISVEINTSKNDLFLIQSECKSDDYVTNLEIKANTPVPQLQNIAFNGSLNSTGIHKSVNGYLKAGNVVVVGDLKSRWKFLEDMLISASGFATNGIFNKSSVLYALYENPNQAFYNLHVAADGRIDTIWDAGMNATLRLPKSTPSVVSTMGLEGNFKVPNGNGEVHSFNSYLDYTKSLKNLNYLVKYASTVYSNKYGIWGMANIEQHENMTCTIDLEWDKSVYENYANMKLEKKNIELIYKLKTPKYSNKQFLITGIKYVPLKDRYNVTLEAFHPESERIAFVGVDFSELVNMKGKFNVTIPHPALNYTGANFNLETNEVVTDRYIQLFWQGNDAVLNSKCRTERGSQLPDSNKKGTLSLEIPLKTRHIINVDYNYNETGQISAGKALINYNGEEVLESIYKCISESKAGEEKDTVHAELINQFLPLTADYLHKYSYGATQDDDTLDTKHIRIYHTKIPSKFDVTGELEVHDVWGGKEYTITAIHANKTVKLSTDYNIFDQIFKQHSRLELSPNHWLEYELSIVNRTKDAIYDVQEVIIEITYPQRSFLSKGSYNISESTIVSDLSIEWDADQKTVSGGFNWTKISHNKNQLTLLLKHPTFEKDVSFMGEYSYASRSIDGNLIVDYSLDPEKLLTVKGKLSDMSDVFSYNYTCKLNAEHNTTNLRLDSSANIFWNPTIFGNDYLTKYKRSYMPESTSETLIKIDFDNKEIELKKDIIASGYSYFWGRYGGNYPIYTANMSSIYNDKNKWSSQFLVNFKNSLTYLHMNLTEDGSQSLHMNGIIPDARSILFDIWREYDDLIVSDVAYYLKLNHSRLVTSRLEWRSELYSDVKSTIRGGAMQLYTDFLEGINNTKQYVKSETMETLNGIWQDAKPQVQQFLDDLKNISIIEQDFEEFKVFLTNSYEENQFYIKDIVNITLTIFDELALKSQLQTLPKIFQELWSMMGDSGEKIKKSIFWVIEEIKTYYKKTTDFIRGLINGDPIENISGGLEKLLEKYDSYIKNIHISLLQYMESLWNQTYDILVENWHTFLVSLEPTFLKFVHYVESVAWNTGRELLDFFYERKNEFIESDFFVKFTKFSQDVDKFYKDITGNNTITAIVKYSQKGWNFLKEKYIDEIPFGKELLDVANEILDELKQIEDIPSVKFLLEKWHEMCNSFSYYYDYLGLEEKLRNLLFIISKKITEVSVTALDIDNRQREAKTKFIFEPNDGIMVLEQKLPMSWHAFNETPNFKEIPEIKKMFDIIEFFETSKVTFWDIYYNYMMFMDSSNWLPPFTGRAMLIGSKYYITFDKRFYGFQGECTYLLANDFDNHNFTLLMSYDRKLEKKELIIILDKTIIRVILNKNRILVGDSDMEYLPQQFGDVYLYRDSALFILESKIGFRLECNMIYETCAFEMSGWYSGKTAGLWGTYNNEPADDFLTAYQTKHREASLASFVNGWSIDKNCKTKVNQKKQKTEVNQEIQIMCDEFFTSKVSQLADCFNRVPKEYFYSICLNGTSKRDACMAAVSYINMCSHVYAPLRIPDTCVQCNTHTGTEIKEGDFIRFEGEDVPKHADIVFILEAKSCNKNFKQAKNVEMLVDLVEKEFQQRNFTNNRYSLVTFGGDGVFDETRSVVINGENFANSSGIMKYFDKINIGNGNEDIFSAIVFAYNIISRPEATRTFILIPCSKCNSYKMEYDYATVHELLSEGSISLHILMDEKFKTQKEGEARIPFGIDKQFAYTKRDGRNLVGDQSLRKIVSLPKASLGQCLSLAMETNGTVFSSKFLETDKRNAKKFATVYSQLIARSTVPPHCKDCECTATDNGIAYMECYLCTMTSLNKNNAEMLLSFEGDDLTSINLFEEFNS